MLENIEVGDIRGREQKKSNKKSVKGKNKNKILLK